MDLAEEGLNASPWPCSGSLANSGGAAGEIQGGLFGPATPSEVGTDCAGNLDLTLRHGSVLWENANSGCFHFSLG